MCIKREAFASDIEHRAADLIWANNHPSGDLGHYNGTSLEIGKLVGIPVLDHGIVGGDNYTSFDEKGLL